MISGNGRIGIMIAAAVVAAAMCDRAAAAVLVIDSAQNTSGYAESVAFSNWATSAVNGQYRFTSTSGATATYTPGNVGSFAPGTYDVYVAWGVGLTAHSTAVNNNFANTTPVSGSLTNVINQQQNSNGNTAGKLQSANGGGSGYRLLGSYTLGSTSTLTLNRAGSTQFSADAMMIRDRAADGLFIDQQSSNVTVGSGAFTLHALSTAPSGNYHATATGGATLIWDPGAAIPGAYNVQVSWVAHTQHSHDIDYFVDIDGDGVFDAIDGDTIVNVNQELLANQTTAAGSTVTWSGYFDLGDYALTALSRIRQGGAGSTIGEGVGQARSVMTATAMIVTELPAVIPTPAALPGGLVILTLAMTRRRR